MNRVLFTNHKSSSQAFQSESTMGAYNYAEMFGRNLGGIRSEGNGSLTILIIVCILFFAVWTPMLCRRRCRDSLNFGNSDNRVLRDVERQAEIIRMNLRRLGLDGVFSNQVPSGRMLNPMWSLRPQDRKEFLCNLLVSRKIIKATKEEEAGGGDDCSTKSNNKTSLLLVDEFAPSDETATKKLLSVEPCSICFEEFEEGQTLCWSQNSHCDHFFHKNCAIEWLMKSDQCPLCRCNFLSLEDDDEVAMGMEESLDSNRNTLPPFGHLAMPTTQDLQRAMAGFNDDEARSFLRGLQLFYILNQPLEAGEANTNSIQLGDIELGENGRRSNVQAPIRQHDRASLNDESSRRQRRVAVPVLPLEASEEESHALPTATTRTH